jgi:hypothetical protein
LNAGIRNAGGIARFGEFVKVSAEPVIHPGAMTGYSAIIGSKRLAT